jgi:hypothetical protein
MEHYLQTFGNTTDLTIFDSLNSNNAKIFLFFLVKTQLQGLVEPLQYTNKDLEYFAYNSEIVLLSCNYNWTKTNYKGRTRYEILKSKYKLHTITAEKKAIFEIPVPRNLQSDVTHILNGEYSKISEFKTLVTPNSFADFIIQKHPVISDFFSRLEDYCDVNIQQNFKKGEVFHKFNVEKDYLKPKQSVRISHHYC